MRTKRLISLLVLPVILLLSACGGRNPQTPAPTSDVLSQLATQAVMTQQAFQALQPTPLPTETIAAIVATSQPGPTPTSTPTPIPCNKATFVQDVTIADGSRVKPGEPMRKVWRLRNDGTCTWTGYSLVFYEGTNMGASVVAINATVNPGETVDLSIDLTAPNTTGSYTGNYRLRDASGNTFGITSRSGQEMSFWVKITVELTQVVYDLTNDGANSLWQDQVGQLTFNADAGADRGAAFEAISPTMEDKAHANDRGFEVRPNKAPQGYVQGTFPYYTVQQGDHFITTVGCRSDAKQCYIKFQLSYKEEGGAPAVLASWAEKHEGLVRDVDVDLSKLAGRRIALILTIFAEDDATGDVGIWLHPRIMR